MPGILIAAPMSGSGKTTFTLGLLRALKDRGLALASGKAGPDYIDPAFHTAAGGVPCFNYDPWAMRPELLRSQAAMAGDGILVVEAMMGLFDGAADGSGSAADLAALLGMPAVLVVNCAKMSHSVAALVHGFLTYRCDITIAGVVLNNVGSLRHETMLREALAGQGVTVFGAVRRDDALHLPDRHLGLVQAGEHAALEQFIDRAAHCVREGCDVDALVAAAKPLDPVSAAAQPLSPPGQRIAVARDLAFAFAYSHLLKGWRDQGAQLRFFSPIADEGPDSDCDAIYLPGGYPELHAGEIAAADTFRGALHRAVEHGVPVYGECGGYMVLGEGLVDAAGIRHRMLGLLPLTTSFAKRRLHLGYRRLEPVNGFWWSEPLNGHEFHYATTIGEGAAEPLFSVKDARDGALPAAGMRRGKVAGSFMHIIDRQVAG